MAVFEVTLQGFPLGFDQWGIVLCKTAKNYMKITKSTFLGQNNEDNSEGQKGGQENFVGIGGIPQSPH